MPYRRVLLKLSGEALEGAKGKSIDPTTIKRIAQEIARVGEAGVQVGIVVGGGNLFRGMTIAAEGMDRTAADTMGMLATIMNCVALQDALLRIGKSARIMSAIPVMQVADPFTQRAALAALEDGEVVLLGGGTGNPYFTTDTAAALRALEIHADVLLKATRVDGVYDKDPKRHPDAVRFPNITYREILEKQLQVMDATAVALCRDHHLPMIVFDLSKEGNICRAVAGEPIGTLIEGEKHGR